MSPFTDEQILIFSKLKEDADLQKHTGIFLISVTYIKNMLSKIKKLYILSFSYFSDFNYYAI